MSEEMDSIRVKVHTDLLLASRLCALNRGMTFPEFLSGLLMREAATELAQIPASRRHPSQQWIEQTPENRRAGYVYLMRADTGHYKIGQAKRVDERLAIFAVRLPIAVELVHSIWVEDRFAGERRAHGLFKSRRIEGEWFKMRRQDVKQFKALTPAALK